MRKNIKLAAGITIALGLTSGVNATVYDVTGVLSGVDGGFGFSGFHYAGDLGTGIDGDGNNMTGTQLVDIPEAYGYFGTYDDVSGDFNVTLNTNSTVVTSFDLSGNMSYGLDGYLNPTSSLDITFYTIVGDFTTNMVFAAGEVCCSGATNPPNSFSGGLISLWGVNDTPELATAFSGYNGEVLGLDLRLELTAVPVPAAVWLFGSGLLGLIGVARRRV